MDRGCEIRYAQRRLRFIDTFHVHIDSGETAVVPYPLAEAFDPERRAASGVEHIEAPDVSQEVELAVTEGDEVVFELLSLLRRQGVPFV